MPSIGRYVGAKSKPWPLYKANKDAGERLGLHWLVGTVTGKRALRHVSIDSNYWKSVLRDLLTTAIGGAGALTLFGRGRETLAQRVGRPAPSATPPSSPRTPR